MKLRNEVTIDQAIKLLNEALSADPKAISELISFRVACSKTLDSHPSIQCGFRNNTTTIGLLGILNGLFGTYEEGCGPISAIVESDLRTIIGFERTKCN